MCILHIGTATTTIIINARVVRIKIGFIRSPLSLWEIDGWN